MAGLNNASTDAQNSKTGGWLDAVTYQAGLSGGSWATGTTVVNNYTLPTDLVKNVSRPACFAVACIPLSGWSLRGSNETTGRTGAGCSEDTAGLRDCSLPRS